MASTDPCLDEPGGNLAPKNTESRLRKLATVARQKVAARSGSWHFFDRLAFGVACRTVGDCGNTYPHPVGETLSTQLQVLLQGCRLLWARDRS